MKDSSASVPCINLANEHTRKAVFAAFGEVFCGIGVREPLPNASEAFTKFGDAHRNMEKHAIDTLKKLKPVCKQPIN